MERKSLERALAALQTGVRAAITIIEDGGSRGPDPLPASQLAEALQAIADRAIFDATATAKQALAGKRVISPDMLRLVIAAREVAYGPTSFLCAQRDSECHADLQQLDKAAEAFAAAVPWDDEPEGAETIVLGFTADGGVVTRVQQAIAPDQWETYFAEPGYTLQRSFAVDLNDHANEGVIEFWRDAVANGEPIDGPNTLHIGEDAAVELNIDWGGLDTDHAIVGLTLADADEGDLVPIVLDDPSEDYRDSGDCTQFGNFANVTSRAQAERMARSHHRVPSEIVEGVCNLRFEPSVEISDIVDINGVRYANLARLDRIIGEMWLSTTCPDLGAMTKKGAWYHGRDKVAQNIQQAIGASLAAGPA